MARSIETDPFHNFKFHVVDPAGGNLDPVAGFATVSIPEVAVGEVTYREGIDIWTKKFPGIPTVNAVTLTKGVFRRDSDFLNWVLKVINGGREYRTELIIQEYHISDEFGINGSPSRVITLRECWGLSAKPSDDKDASGEAVSMQSLTLAVEEFSVQILGD